MTALETMEQYAWRLVGTPYLWGGDDTIYGFDCSGFTQEILMAVGEDPPGDQTAQAYYDYFLPRSGRDSFELGALAFYGRDDRHVTHVAFCISALCCIEAAGGDATTNSLARAALQNAFVKPRPIRDRRDLITALRPRYRFEG